MKCIYIIPKKFFIRLRWGHGGNVSLFIQLTIFSPTYIAVLFWDISVISFTKKMIDIRMLP